MCTKLSYLNGNLIYLNNNICDGIFILFVLIEGSSQSICHQLTLIIDFILSSSNTEINVSSLESPVFNGVIGYSVI